MTPADVAAAARSRGREWRQFRLLSRDSIRQLLHAAVLSRSGDPMLFAIWLTALIATWPAVYSVRAVMRYASAPADVAPSAVEFLLVNDRLFFILYAMMASALVAALTWESLFPSTADQEALGPLPVRPRTVAGARLAAALTIAVGVGTAVGGPSAVLYGVIAFITPLAGFPPLVLIAHIVVIAAAAVFVFAALLSLRAGVALVAGAAAADRLALLLQVVTVFGLVETLMYLPTVMPFLVRQMADGSWASWLPPVWFGALYSGITGSAATLNGTFAPWAAASSALALGSATLTYLAPARLMARRALEAQSRQRAGRLATFVQALSSALRLRPQVASVFEFTLTSLFRNPRHLLIVAGYFGAGLGIGAVFVITAELRGTLLPSPQTASLTFPLVAIFMTVFGFRSAFNVPTDLAANWTFRLRPPLLYGCITGARLAVMMMGVVPVVLVTMAAVTSGGWTWSDTLAVGAFDLLMGALLIEVALFGWPKIPFTCARVPDSDTVRFRWLLGAVALNVFAARGADIQLLALGSLWGTVILVGLLLCSVAVLRYANSREAARLEIEFDGPPDSSMQTLGLSEAER